MGALFFVNAFPSFLDGVLSPHLPVSPTIVQSSRQAQYQQHSILPHHGPPHNSDSNSPEEGCIANHGQDPYRYIIPRDGNLATYPNLGQGSSSSQGTNGYTTYSPAHWKKIRPLYPLTGLQWILFSSPAPKFSCDFLLNYLNTLCFLCYLFLKHPSLQPSLPHSPTVST